MMKLRNMGFYQFMEDFIAFPKNNNVRDTMTDAPSTISQDQLDELCISLIVKE